MEVSKGPPQVMSRSATSGVGPNTSAVGKASLGYTTTRSTRKETALEPSSTVTKSPGSKYRKLKNTPGPVVESTWPMMTAGPVSPGTGPRSYHPVKLVPDGTIADPSGF